MHYVLYLRTRRTLTITLIIINVVCGSYRIRFDQAIVSILLPRSISFFAFLTVYAGQSTHIALLMSGVVTAWTCVVRKGNCIYGPPREGQECDARKTVNGCAVTIGHTSTQRHLCFPDSEIGFTETPGIVIYWWSTSVNFTMLDHGYSAVAVGCEG